MPLISYATDVASESPECCWLEANAALAVQSETLWIDYIPVPLRNNDHAGAILL